MTDQSPSPYSGLIERLEAVESGADCNPGRAGQVTSWHRNPDGPEAASAIRDLEAENARKADKIEGLHADLRMAVQVAWKRGAREWARLNYASLVPWLEASDEADRAREQQKHADARAALSGRAGT